MKQNSLWKLLRKIHEDENGAISLETHWKGGGTPEESSRQSWAGMKKVLAEAGAL